MYKMLAHWVGKVLEDCVCERKRKTHESLKRETVEAKRKKKNLNVNIHQETGFNLLNIKQGQ